MSANNVGGTIAVVAIVAVLAIGIPWGLWKLTRWWNYNMGYESQVTETVCAMVKHKHLTIEGLEQCK